MHNLDFTKADEDGQKNDLIQRVILEKLRELNYDLSDNPDMFQDQG